MILSVFFFTNCLLEFSYGGKEDLEKPYRYEDNCCEKLSFHIVKNKSNKKFINGLSSKPSGKFLRTGKSMERRHMDAKDTLKVCGSMKINDMKKKLCNNSQFHTKKVISRRINIVFFHIHVHVYFYGGWFLSQAILSKIVEWLRIQAKQ